MLAEPPPSQADIHFRLWDIPVRIHPFFWLITLILFGWRDESPPLEVLLWVLAVVISILIHELGHALTQRHFGGQPRIVLHSLGGLAICQDCDRTTRAQILISLAGPAAGFACAAAVWLGLLLTGHQPGLVAASAGPVAPPWMVILGVKVHWLGFPNTAINLLVANLLRINILWGLMNLLPIYPLDGGQVARELCLLGNPRQGMLLSLRISVFAAAAMVLWGITEKSLFLAVMFGYLAYASWKTLENYRASLW